MTDTIYVALKDTISSQQEMIGVYRDLLQNQQTIYYIFIIILLGLLGANILANYVSNKRRLKAEVEDVFNEKEKTFRKDLESYIDKAIKVHTKKSELQFKTMQAETFRLFAISAENQGSYGQSFDYYIKAVSPYNEIGQQNIARICGKMALDMVNESVTKKINLWGGLYFSKVTDRESLMEILEGFPDYLTQEKKEILRLIPKKDDNNNKTKTEPKENS